MFIVKTNPMKYILILMLNICLTSNLALAIPAISAADHSTWNNLLKSHVTEDGKVDYKGFIKDKIRLNAYTQYLSEHTPDKSWSENEKLAYWINAYNAFTIALIIEHYPTKSIMDIKNAWDIDFIHLGNKTYTLNDIEHQIIRKEFDEPRIHFVLVCAAISCPVLLNEAYISAKLDQQLQHQGELFINDPSKNSIKANKANVSQLFNWFGDDFTKNGSLIDYLNQFSEIKLDPNATIDFLEYNWDLNE